MNDLQSVLEECLSRHRLPGASVAVYFKGALHVAAAGVTNIDTGVALTPDTVMHIGSITKVLNATLIMQLVDEGRIELERPVRDYLPELRLRDREALERITVKMLLNHTSGIDGDALEAEGRDRETLDNAVRRMADLGQIHEPGREYSYCNAGTALAGYLAQRLTGIGWYRLIRERIFTPLQMTHSAASPEEALLYRAAVGHFRLPAPSRKLVRVSRMFLPLGLAPAGACLMLSARDLVSFTRAHFSSGLLSERSAQAMRRVTVDNRDKGYAFTDGIGLGWMVCADGLLHHAGGGPGIVAVLYAHPERDFIAVIQTNAEFSLSSRLIDELLGTWFEAAGIEHPPGYRSVPRPAHALPCDPEKYVGVYANNTTTFEILRDGDGIKLSSRAKWALYEYTSLEPAAFAPLIPLGSDRFLLSGPGHDATSVPDGFQTFVFRTPLPDGRMQHLGNCDRLYRRVGS